MIYLLLPRRVISNIHFPFYAPPHPLPPLRGIFSRSGEKFCRRNSENFDRHNLRKVRLENESFQSFRISVGLKWAHVLSTAVNCSLRIRKNSIKFVNWRRAVERKSCLLFHRKSCRIKRPRGFLQFLTIGFAPHSPKKS